MFFLKVAFILMGLVAFLGAVYLLSMLLVILLDS